MIFDLGALIERLLSVALPTVLGLQPGIENVSAIARIETTVFRPVSADVTNWRLEAVNQLDMPMKTGTLVLLSGASLRMPRCIKLNNYWCIKKAGWRGEKGGDAEDHAAFDTAGAGARAAAVLLRRYYLDFHRHSALAIVSRWAPNRCLRPVPVPLVGGLPVAPRLARWQSMSKEQREQAADRLLAERRRAAEARYQMTMHAIAAARKMPPTTYQKPKQPSEASTSAALSPGKRRAARVKFQAPRAPISCALEAARISSYAARAIEGIVSSPTEDLELFDDKGASTWRLIRLMTNMASVEIGPYRIGRNLVPAALVAMDVDTGPDVVGAMPENDGEPARSRYNGLPTGLSERRRVKAIQASH